MNTVTIYIWTIRIRDDESKRSPFGMDNYTPAI